MKTIGLWSNTAKNPPPVDWERLKQESDADFAAGLFTYASVTGRQSSIHRDKPGGVDTARSRTLI
jgi:hypothetical protein